MDFFAWRMAQSVVASVKEEAGRKMLAGRWIKWAINCAIEEEKRVELNARMYAMALNER